MNEIKFYIGDEVEVLDMRQVEDDAGRDTYRDCASISDKEDYIVFKGTIIGKDSVMYRNVGLRDVYEVEFDEEETRDCSYGARQWFHPEWLMLTKYSRCKYLESPEITDMFSELNG